jgi:CheY-like chemotaxis protein
LKLALEWLPDIVLLDISMPQLDGFAVVRRLRAEPLLKEVVVVALTAHDEAFVTKRAMPNEFDAYCQKGNPATALAALLGQLTSGAMTF